jgi:hypothetical protein
MRKFLWRSTDPHLAQLTLAVARFDTQRIAKRSLIQRKNRLTGYG